MYQNMLPGIQPLKIRIVEAIPKRIGGTHLIHKHHAHRYYTAISPPLCTPFPPQDQPTRSVRGQPLFTPTPQHCESGMCQQSPVVRRVNVWCSSFFYIYAMFHGARHESYCHFDYSHFHIHRGWQSIPGERAQMGFGMLGSFVFDGEWRGLRFTNLHEQKHRIV